MGVRFLHFTQIDKTISVDCDKSFIHTDTHTHPKY